jgi:uncharacterized protein (DUF486 family)
MNKFRQWYLSNQIQITWFLIGFLVYAGLVDFGRGNYFGAFLSWGIAVINYIFVKRT